MSKDNHHIDWKNKFLRYLKGELSAREEHQLEKKVLDDPFDQEAMEGLENWDPEIIQKDVASLSEQIQQKKSNYYLYRIAAAVVILLVASITWLLVPMQDEASLAQKEDIIEEQLSAAEPPVTEEAPDIHLEVVEEDELSESGEEAVPVSPQSEESTITKPVESEPVADAAADEIPPEEVLAEIITTEEEVSGNEDISRARQVESLGYAIADTPEEEFADDETAEVEGVEFRSRRVEVPKGSKKVFGKVLTVEGDALAGVNVIVSGTSTGTVTDMDGNYELEVPDDASLSISFIGFEQQEISVTSESESLDIILEEDVASLSEVVVVGKQKKNQSPEPIGGKEGFDDFVEKNRKDIVGEAGNVVLKVSLTETGEVASIEVLKSLSKLQDEEAIRLVESYEGFKPKVKNGQNIKSAIRLKIAFN